MLGQILLLWTKIMVLIIKALKYFMLGQILLLWTKIMVLIIKEGLIQYNKILKVSLKSVMRD